MFKHMKMEEGINSGMEINANAVAGASEHMCFDSTFFKSLSSLTPPLTINLPNCQTILVTHIGTGLLMRRSQVFGKVSEVPNISSPDSLPSDSPISASPLQNCSSPKSSFIPDSNLPTTSLPLRRSERSTKGIKPVHLQDYFCNNIFLSHVSEFCFAAPIPSTGLSHTEISTSNQLFLESVSQITEPNNYYQPSLHPGSPISWKSKKQAFISVSSAEDEYHSMRRLVAELTWLTRLLADLS
uniref:Uncharacterized protein n=1 Tax=Solanum lycopersicum TaxID=4081 RepID=A0A3Q7HM26_SOLLC